MNTRAMISADSLNAVDLFRGLPLARRSEIATRLSAHRYAAGTPVVDQQGHEQDVYFIVSGSVRVTFSVSSGKAVQFRDQHAGEMFGELAALDGRPRSAEVSCLTDVFLARASASEFLAIATGCPAIAERIFVQLAARIRALSDRVVEFSTLGVSNRIHGELLRLAREHEVHNNHAEIKPAPTHADIAARVSTHREAVTRELAVLARSGVVKRGRGVLQIIDVERLSELVSNVANN